MTIRNSENALVVFAKYPVPGEVKTRLSKQVGRDAATAFYACSIRYLLNRLQQKSGIFDIIIAVGQESRLHDFRAEFTGGDGYVAQDQTPDLGRRMRTTIKDCLHDGYKKVGVIGTDSPNLPIDAIVEGFERLDTVDLVVAPAEDGGYYHIAVGADIPALFENIEWSTETVFEKTMQIADSLELRVHVGPVFYDIDDVSGLRKLWRDVPGFFTASGLLDSNPELKNALLL